MSNEKLYEQIIGKLRAAIADGTLAPGDRVPSVKELREEFGVSHITVLRAYKELAAGNEIVQRSNKGYFVREPESASRPELTGRIGCFIRTLSSYNRCDNYFNDITCGIQSECAARRLNLIVSHTTAPLNFKPVSQATFDTIAEAMIRIEAEVDGFLVDEHFPDPLLARLQTQITKPMVLINRRSELAIRTVTPAWRDNVFRGLDIAVRMGYAGAVYMHDFVRTSNRDEAYRAFDEFTALRNWPSEYIARIGECNLKPHPESCREALAAIVAIRDTGCEKVLVMTESDAFCRVLVDFFHAGGHGVHAGIGVISMEGLGYCTEHAPLICALRPNAEGIGRLAVEVLIHAVDGKYMPVGNYAPAADFYFGETL